MHLQYLQKSHVLCSHDHKYGQSNHMDTPDRMRINLYQVRRPSALPKRKPKKSRILVISLVSAALIITASVLTYIFWPKDKPKTPIYKKLSSTNKSDEKPDQPKNQGAFDTDDSESEEPPHTEEIITELQSDNEEPPKLIEEPLNIIDELPKPDNPSNKPDELAVEEEGDILEPNKPIDTPFLPSSPNTEPPKQPEPITVPMPDSKPDELPFTFSNELNPLPPPKTEDDRLFKPNFSTRNFSFMKDQDRVRSTPFEDCGFASLPWRIAFAIPQIHLKYLDSKREFDSMVIYGELEISSEEYGRQFCDYNVQRHPLQVVAGEFKLNGFGGRGLSLEKLKVAVSDDINAKRTPPPLLFIDGCTADYEFKNGTFAVKDSEGNEYIYKAIVAIDNLTTLFLRGQFGKVWSCLAVYASRLATLLNLVPTGVEHAIFSLYSVNGVVLKDKYMIKYVKNYPDNIKL